jgi:hypothetical protein
VANGVKVSRAQAAGFQFVAHFTREALLPFAIGNAALLQVDGKLANGPPFRGHAIVKVIN